MQHRLEIPVGTRFGMLTIVRNVGGPKWECKCDCGNIVIVNGSSLNSGNKRSCGCLHSMNLAARNVANAKHGGKSNGKTERLYRIWDGMKKRCENSNSDAFVLYGGRGIRVCDEWKHDYSQFREWALRSGYRDDLTIDRIDTDGDYEPFNCRWANAKEQANNRRNNHLIEYNGKKQSINEWAKETGLSYRVIHSRIFQYGWDIEKTLTTKLQRAK